MQQLIMEESKAVYGGTGVAQACVEGTGIGAVIGGVLGGLITSPIYYTLMSREGISSSHQMMSFFVVGIGVTAGVIVGSAIGGGTSYLAACQVAGDH